MAKLKKIKRRKKRKIQLISFFNFSDNLKFFLIACLISIPFWWGINLLEKNFQDFFFLREISKNPQMLVAQLNQQKLEERLREIKPIRDYRVENLEINAKSAVSVFVIGDREKSLFDKNSFRQLPVASLSKLMTALVVLENYDLAKTIKISEEAFNQEGEAGKLEPGEELRVKDLLYVLLIESSNDAAYALANDYNEITEEKFVELMNLEIEKLNLKDTHFINSTGLGIGNFNNYSNSEDLIKFTEYLLNYSPADSQVNIWEILSTKEFALYLANGSFHHQLENTNELLGEIPLIIGGKTGWTPAAQGCLLLVLEAPKHQGFLINVILGSQDRFGEMKKLIDWTYQAYKW